MHNFKGIVLLFLVLGTLTSCGFTKKSLTTPTTTNFGISGPFGDFNALVQAKLNPAINSETTVTISQVSQEKFEEAYRSDKVSIHRLVVTVEFSMKNGGHTPITHTLTSQKFINTAQTSSRTTQEQEAYAAMTEELVSQLIAIVHAHQ